MGRREKRKPVIRVLTTATELGARLQMLMALAMRPEQLSRQELRLIRSELAALRGRAH